MVKQESPQCPKQSITKNANTANYGNLMIVFQKVWVIIKGQSLIIKSHKHAKGCNTDKL